MILRRPLLAVTALALVACTDSAQLDGSGMGGVNGTGPVAPAVADAEPPPDVRPVTSSTSLQPALLTSIRGTVISTLDGLPMAGAKVSVGEASVVTGVDGAFALDQVDATEPVLAERPVWQTVTVDAAQIPPGGPLVIEMEPFIVRALRVARPAAADPNRFEDLLTMADSTVVNTLVFDTKDEEDTVLYDTEVAFAAEIGAVDPIYDPVALLAEAEEHGLYTITRIVTFEDSTWAAADDQAKLAGAWVDAANRDNWQYPLDLAVEACGLGFDEVQFDYVRFPAGQTAIAAAARIPDTSTDRAAVIAAFLAEARDLLSPLGCGVSAAIFGIVMSSETDEGVGQTPETVSAEVDAVSPMLYPSHYGSGWLGFDDPNDHPGPVVAHALATGGDRLAPTALLRPWLQGFYYGGEDVLAQIHEVEQRGAGWIIWNANGNYQRDWLPSD